MSALAREGDLLVKSRSFCIKVGLVRLMVLLQRLVISISLWKVSFSLFRCLLFSMSYLVVVLLGYSRKGMFFLK